MRTLDLALVLLVLAAAVVMFVINRPRMDAVALLVLVAMPLTGIIIMNEVHRRGAPPRRLARRQGGHQWSGLPIILMAAVGRLSSLMSSTAGSRHLPALG